MMMTLMKFASYVQKKQRKRTWMMKTRSSSLVYHPAMWCILHLIPRMLYEVIVPLQVITNIGKKRILWNQVLWGMNVGTGHSRLMN